MGKSLGQVEPWQETGFRSLSCLVSVVSSRWHHHSLEMRWPARGRFPQCWEGPSEICALQHALKLTLGVVTAHFEWWVWWGHRFGSGWETPYTPQSWFWFRVPISRLY